MLIFLRDCRCRKIGTESPGMGTWENEHCNTYFYLSFGMSKFKRSLGFWSFLIWDVESKIKISSQEEAVSCQEIGMYISLLSSIKTSPSETQDPFSNNKHWNGLCFPCQIFFVVVEHCLIVLWVTVFYEKLIEVFMKLRTFYGFILFQIQT